MGQCTSKPTIQKKQQKNQRTKTSQTVPRTEANQKMKETMVKYDDNIINKRHQRIVEDQDKGQQLKKKLQLIRNGKYDEAGIKPANAYFQMIKIQKQIELVQQKVQKSKFQISKFESRKTINT